MKSRNVINIAIDNCQKSMFRCVGYWISFRKNEKSENKFRVELVTDPKRKYPEIWYVNVNIAEDLGYEMDDVNEQYFNVK